MINIATCALMMLPTGQDGAPPKRLCLLKADAEGFVRGKDGRGWKLSDPLAVIQYLKARGNPLTLDENHSMERRAPKGLSSPALARIQPEHVSVNAAGEIWADQVEWTPLGIKRVAEGAYLGLSPAIVFDTASADDTLGIMGSVVGLSSAGLVNDPNLDLPAALNDRKSKDNPLDPAEIRKTLGLAADATDDQVREGLKSLKQPAPAVDPQAIAPNSVQPLAPAPAPAPADDKPPAWAVAMNAQIQALTAKVEASTEEAQASHKIAVNSAIERFISEGKLAPSAKDYAEVQCKTPEGLKAFVDYHEKAPAIVAAVATNSAQPPGGKLRDLTPDEEKMRIAGGLTKAEYLEDN